MQLFFEKNYFLEFYKQSYGFFAILSALKQVPWLFMAAQDGLLFQNVI